MKNTESNPAPSASGRISLEQFAGVSAATAEGIALEAVLAQERITPEVWTAESGRWREAIASDPSLEAELVRHRRVAADCLGRKVSPVDEDPVAWVGLLRALAATDDVAAHLAKLGITTSDVARLGRAWKRRTAEDAALGDRLRELSATALAPTELTVEPQTLRRFPWSPEAPPAAREATVSAAVAAALDAAPRAPVARQRASFQLAPPTAPTAPIPSSERTETEEVDGRALVAQLTRGVLPFHPDAAPRAPAPSAQSIEDLERGETVLVDGSAIQQTLREGALPFANEADRARATIEGRIERFASIQLALMYATDWHASLSTYGLTQETWERERRELAVAVDQDPALRAVYEGAWRRAVAR